MKSLLPVNRQIFEVGVAPSLDQVLLDRERRAQFQTHLMDMFPNRTLIVLKINVPGPIKNNETIKYLLDKGQALLQNQLKDQGFEMLYFKVVSTIASNNLFVVVDSEQAVALKALCVKLEEDAPLGRLLDFDVFTCQRAVTRKDLGHAPRRCFLCDKDAKDCGRQRTHSVEALLDAFCAIINAEGSI